jgi:DNA-binding transcriptional LysR family regulator
MVADLGSMTAASEALYIAQPSVSQAIADLENFYGVKLFDRLSKRLYITDSGRKLLSYARHITALSDEMDQAMKNPEQTGLIRIGASVTAGAQFLPELVLEFTAGFPAIQVQAISRNTKDIESMILRNEVDFAVVEGTVRSPDIVAEPLMDDELVLVCGRSHPLYSAESMAPGDLSSVRFIIREPGSGHRELFESVMAAKDIDWSFVWECNGSDSLKNAAIRGIGVGVISKLLVEYELRSGELRVLRAEGVDFKRKFCIIYHKNKYLSESMKAFFQICRRYAEKHGRNVHGV